MFYLIFFSSIITMLIIFFDQVDFVVPAILDRHFDDHINSIEDKIPNYGNKYQKLTDKCEIRIVTSGVCSVNNHLVKPKIYVKRIYRDKQIPIYMRPKIDKRFLTMKSFKMEEQKANTLVDQFLIQFKEHFGKEIDPMIIPDFGDFKLNDIGTVNIYDLRLKGISNIKRDGSIALHSDSQMNKWSINANLSIDNITADFKVDAKLKSKVYIKGWTLQVLIKQCLLNSILEFDSKTKILSISSLIVTSIEGFDLNSENLSWPFRQLVQQILDHQMKELKSVISISAQKYFTQTLKSFDVTKIIENLNSKDKKID